MSDSHTRRLPIGAEPLRDGTHFRVWAPASRRVVVRVEGVEGRATAEQPLETEADGYHSGLLRGVAAGARYRYVLDDGSALPDPASRFQPQGPQGSSEVVDPARYRWADDAWRGVSGENGQILYEMHVGTYTQEGTWSSAIERLPELVDLGVTVVEVLPIADFTGRFGWGYDGVDLFAPTRLYGSPDDARRFVDRAHGLGLGVILDVVYNHFGPTGNFWTSFAPAYHTDRYRNEWGTAINFDGPDSGPVREFFATNAAYWVEEFHFDGLRIDAAHSMHDASSDHILSVIRRRVSRAACGRATFVVGENEPQLAFMARPLDAGGHGMEALWNEDFHHVASIVATGRREGYYADYHGSAQEFLSMATRGFLYQGQINRRQGKRRGTPTRGLPPRRFVNYLQNHDQVANTLRGERLNTRTDPAMYRAMTAWWLLSPGTPMFFQGQEFAASTPFHYFCDQGDELSDRICRGRGEFLSQFASLATPEAQEALTDPCDPETFARSKLNWDDRVANAAVLELHRDLIRLRREDPVLAGRRPEDCSGAVLSDRAFAFRCFASDGGDRLILANFGDELKYEPPTEPLLAAPAERRWRIVWSSEEVRYGGDGTPAPEDTEEGWRLLRRSVLVLVAVPGRPEEPAQ